MTQKIYQKYWFWLIVALIVVALDQWSKIAAVNNCTYGEMCVSLTSFFDFRLHYNSGAAFSFLAEAGGWQRWFFGVIAIVASVLLIIWIYKSAAQKPIEAFALSFILGGALGNLYDRIVLGHVVDFIHFYYQSWSFPVFNLADSAITLGAIVIIVDMLFAKEKKADA